MRSATTWKWVGIALILLIAIIHLFEAPGQFSDATYKGILFLLAAAGGVVTAVGMWRRVPYMSLITIMWFLLILDDAIHAT